MKILQINKYPSLRGGSEVVLFDTIDLLKKQGYDVVLFSTDEGDVTFNPTYTVPYPERSASFIKKVSFLRSFFSNKEAIQKLEYIVAKEKPDIVHIHLYLNGLSQSILPVLKKHKIPVVMTLHDYRQICPSYLLLDRHQNVCEKCKRGNYLNCMFSRCSKRGFLESSFLTLEMYYRRIFYKTEKYVDQFICVSDFQKEKYLQFNPTIASKSLVIYNPIKAHADRNIKKGNYLLYCGRLSKEKGLDTLISAMKYFPNINLKVVGKGNLSFSDVTSNIEFLGFKEGTELEALMKNAMFSIVPSECYETFGLSCAESLSLGTPVIASNMGALSEIVEDGKNGFLFEAKNIEDLAVIIKKALSLSDQAYASMVENGYRSVEKFSPDSYIAKLMYVYTSLIKKQV